MTTPKTIFASLALIAALCAGFTLGLTAPAWAGLDEGVAAYKRGDYASALREWRPLAKQGNAKAQYNLGVIYRKGQGVPQDDAEAVKLYRKAADQGDAVAQNNIGFMYDNGRGVPQDYAQAAGGIGAPPTSANPPPSSTWASCTNTAWAWGRTRARRPFGSRAPPKPALPRPSLPWGG